MWCGEGLRDAAMLAIEVGLRRMITFRICLFKIEELGGRKYHKKLKTRLILEKKSWEG